MAGSFFLLHHWLLAGTFGQMSKRTDMLRSSPRSLQFLPQVPETTGWCSAAAGGPVMGFLDTFQGSRSDGAKENCVLMVGVCQWGSSCQRRL